MQLRAIDEETPARAGGREGWPHRFARASALADGGGGGRTLTLALALALTLTLTPTLTRRARAAAVGRWAGRWGGSLR